MSNYRKTMASALQEMYPLDESVIDKVKEIDSKKSAAKIDGVMVDSFTASAISQIYDKVNDANKKKMEKLPIIKLANLAMKMMQKNDYVPEEVDLDEAQDGGDFKPHMMYDPKTGKGYKADTMDDHLKMKKMGYTHDAPKTEEVDLDEGGMKDLLIRAQELMGPSKNRKEGIQMVAKGLKVSEKEATKLVDAVIKMNEELAKIKGKTPGDEGRRSAVEDDIERAEKKGDKKEVEKLKEEDEIEEAFSVEVPKQSIDGKTYGGGASVIVKAKSASHAIKMVAKRLKVDWTALKTGEIVKEEVDLDEAKKKPVSQMTPKEKEADAARRKEYKAYQKSKRNEETDLEEGKMSQLHQYIKDKKSAEEIAKLMKVDVKTIKALMSSYESTDGDNMEQNSEYMEMLAAACGGGAPDMSAMDMDYNPKDEGAAADARRAMKKDKDFSRRDRADDDNSATDDDVKAASKNIMMQMRKVVSMKGDFTVEFGDKKKVKIPVKVAQVVQQKYNSMKRPADKEKFQAQVAKSYKDMLKVLKAGYHEELKPQKESILDRIDKKLKERKNG
jgi:hypothetical protein